MILSGNKIYYLGFFIKHDLKSITDYKVMHLDKIDYTISNLKVMHYIKNMRA